MVSKIAAHCMSKEPRECALRHPMAQYRPTTEEVTHKEHCRMRYEPLKPSSYESLAPHFGELTRDVLFGDIWERPQLSKRERSLITLAALMAMGKTPQLYGHVRRAQENGLAKEEIAEVFMHLAFYCGWPSAINAFDAAKEAMDSQQPKHG